MSKEITLQINKNSVTVPKGTTILEAAKIAGIKIPTLCHHDDLCTAGNCRLCVVEQKGARNLVPSCVTPATENMEIFTNTGTVRNARKTIIELILTEHSGECTSCSKNGACELQTLANEYLIEDNRFIPINKSNTIDFSSPAIIKDDGKCIKCLRCVRTCEELQGLSTLKAIHRGKELTISTFFNEPMDSTICSNCGQCINRCPTGALSENRAINEVWQAIDDPAKHVVVQTAPAVRIGLGEALGMDPGHIVTGKMVSALKALGFNSVLDTDFTADVTILEEGTELLTRLKKALVEKKEVALPMTTSCSPGWIKFIEHKFPSLLNNISTCKSPQQMFGALAKTYYAQKKKLDPANIVSVSVMPCTAKKFEANRPEMNSSGYKDVDYVLTTRELAHMIQQAGLNFQNMPENSYDPIMGDSTGAAVIFGATGGVMEAALRTAYELVTGNEVPFKNLNIKPVRGMDGIKEASIKIENTQKEWAFLEGVELKIAIAHGLANAKKIMEQVEAGKSPYHFIEIMACPGGCLGGGGQPVPTNLSIRQKRTDAIYQADELLPVRKSHLNEEVIALYKDFLGEPLGEKSHDLLHTHYTTRKEQYKND